LSPLRVIGELGAGSFILDQIENPASIVNL
jgi:hypothetical protein